MIKAEKRIQTTRLIRMVGGILVIAGLATIAFVASIGAAIGVILLTWGNNLIQDVRWHQIFDTLDLMAEKVGRAKKCDGNHRTPICADPECWHRDLPADWRKITTEES